MNMNRPYISVVIPEYKEDKNIVKCLEDLSRQTLFDESEIVIASYDPDRNGKTQDAASTVAKSISKKVKWVDVPKKGIGFARHLGVINSSGQYVVNMDAEAQFIENNAIEQMIWPIVHHFAVLTFCNNALDPNEFNPIPITQTLYNLRNLIGSISMMPFPFEQGMTFSRYAYDQSPGFKDVLFNEGPTLATDMTMLFGYHMIQKVDTVTVISSNRRMVQLASKSPLDVFNYNTAFRGNESVNIL